tara:strand:+ start:163 stop:321 length:159 start_codon:yes stop_codon:yes gene_type:complete
VAKAENVGPIPPSTMITDLEKMYEKISKGEEYSDGFVEIGGHRILFHKAILV